MTRLYARAAAFAVLASLLLPGVAAAANGTTAWIVGARPAPPHGAGPGALMAWEPGTENTRKIEFGQAGTPSGNSFYIGYDAEHALLYVPTAAGRTYMFGAHDLSPAGDFESIPGGRVARVSPHSHLLLVASGTQTAAYSTGASPHLQFTADVGGNAIAFEPNGKRAFIGGNRSEQVTEIDTRSGKVTRRFPVARSGDLLWAEGKLYSADMKTGVLSVIDPDSGAVTAIRTEEVDPHFSYSHIGKAEAGFMQMAYAPGDHRVYVAGFSGHILAFSTREPKMIGQVRVAANAHGPNKLSGLAVFADGQEAITTVENIGTAVVVSLADGRILRRLDQVASNRWVKLNDDTAGINLGAGTEQ